MSGARPDEVLELAAALAMLHGTHWGGDLTLDRLTRAAANSLCFGLYERGAQIGFARVVTDYATYGYLCDVVIAEALVTRDPPDLYGRFGFAPPARDLYYLALVGRDSEGRNVTGQSPRSAADLPGPPARSPAVP